MSDQSDGEERSMNEILASIRKIVSDEEKSRQAGASGAAEDIYVLTGDMRADTDAPLDLGTAAPPLRAVGAPPSPPPSVDFDGPAQPLDLGLVSRAGGALNVEDATARTLDAVAGVTPGAPADAVTSDDPSETAPAVDFEPRSGLGEDEVEAIVRRIVREELQGPIGSQISRKVRALIREEIAKMSDDGEPLI